MSISEQKSKSKNHNSNVNRYRTVYSIHTVSVPEKQNEVETQESSIFLAAHRFKAIIAWLPESNVFAE